MKTWFGAIRKFDVRIGLIILLITVSTGHVGRLFADREASGQGIIGYALALGIDGVLAIGLYEVMKTKGRHRGAALAVFLLACGVSGGFNVSYYRIYHPTDPPWTSVLLGLTAPILAASVAVLKSFGDVEREKASAEEHDAGRQNQLELQKYEILQREQTKRTTEQEKTKRAKERTKQQQSRAQTEAKAEETLQKERKGMTAMQRREQIFELLCQDLNQSPKELGQHFGVTAQTIRNDLKDLAKKGKITYKDGRVSLRPQKMVEAKP